MACVRLNDARSVTVRDMGLTAVPGMCSHRSTMWTLVRERGEGARLVIGCRMLEKVRQTGVRKLVTAGTVCAYPKYTAVPFRKNDLWNGYPEETNPPYGLAKKMLLVQGQAYREQYGFNAIELIPVDLYGPDDNFAPECSHVIPALTKKCIDGRDRGDAAIEAWGTGTVSREFLYMEDAAEGIVLVSERYNGPEPVNLGSGREITIRELVALIADLTGFRGEIRWDARRPDGQPRRQLDVSRAARLFTFRAKTPFVGGLRRTIKRYEAIRVDREYDMKAAA